jgi:putative Mn2+ efflux pump MntP
MTTSNFKPQNALGCFALITLLLAGTAVGRSLGVSFDEALYLTGLLLVVLGWISNWLILRRTAPPADAVEVS